MNNPKYWVCIIGPVDDNKLPADADCLPRMAAQQAVIDMIREQPACNSGWCDEAEALRVKKAGYTQPKSEEPDCAELRGRLAIVRAQHEYYRGKVVECVGANEKLKAELDAALSREQRLREAYDNLMGQIEAMRDMAEKYAEESGAEGDQDKAMGNMRVFCVLKELYRLGRSFLDTALAFDGKEGAV